MTLRAQINVVSSFKVHDSSKCVQVVRSLLELLQLARLGGQGSA